MLAILISILIQMGILNSVSDFNNLTPAQKEQYKKEIVIEDLVI
jgi:hypothetical protein